MGTDMASSKLAEINTKWLPFVPQKPMIERQTR
jgi:hypothetical protein